jgi:hypothetical protein
MPYHQEFNTFGRLGCHPYLEPFRKIFYRIDLGCIKFEWFNISVLLHIARPHTPSRFIVKGFVPYHMRGWARDIHYTVVRDFSETILRTGIS